MDQNLEPDDASLDPFTVYQIPPHLTAIQAGTQVLPGPAIQLLGGYNITLTELTDLAGLPTISTPIPPVTRILLSAEPGAGLGAFPDCDDAPDVTTINGIPGNSHQNLVLDAEGCITLFRPVVVTSIDPWEVEYQAPGLTAAEARAAFQIGNNCSACCDCVYFVRTYKGLKRQWELYRTAAATAADLRNDYLAISARWLRQKECREANTIRSLASPDGNSKVSWGVVHCNASKCCLVGLELRLTWIYEVNGVVQLPNVPGYDCRQSTITGAAGIKDGSPIFSARSGATRGIVNEFRWDLSDRQSNVTISGRHCFPEAQPLNDDIIQVTPHWCIMRDSSLPDEDTGNDCDYPIIAPADFPPQVLQMWALTGDPVPLNAISQFLGDPVIIRTDDPYCERCDCEPAESVAPITPRRFENVCLWYDGADTRTMNISGGAVTQWRSKRGMSIQLAVIPGLSPPTYAGGLLQFDGVNNGLAQRFQPLPYAPGYIAGVFSASAVGQVLMTSRTATNPASHIALTSNSVRMGTLPLTTGLGPAGLNILIGTASFIGSTVEQRLYLNGTHVGSNTIDRDGPAEGVFVGTTSGFGSFLEGSLGELLMGCIALQPSDRQILEGYLAAKWSIQSKLPPTHPYRNSVPLGPA